MFHVYVEGVTRPAPDAARRVSDAMAERYGLSADEVYSLMTRGRFRVKANVDQATADRYARELEALGARVQIEEAPRHGRASLPPRSAPSARRAGGGRRRARPSHHRSPRRVSHLTAC